MANIKRIDGKTGPSFKITVTTGRSTDGRQVRHYMTWRPTAGMTERQIEKAVQKAAFEFEQQIEKGFIADNRQSFAQYAEYVIGLKERSGAKKRTVERYRELLVRINAAIGHLKLADSRPLSTKTILEHHRLISAMMSQAEKEMLIQFNPAHRATPPKIERTEVESFQTEELARIMECLEREPIKWRTITHLLIVTGCRRGEIMGLHWDAIDWKGQQLRIDRALLYTAGSGIYEDTTKTGETRFIKVPAETIRLLKQYRSYYDGLRVKNGDRWIESDYVFTRDDGGVMNPDNVTQWLGNFARKYNLPPIHPHKFRHTMASLLIYNGTDALTVSKRLGHAKVSTTTDIYSHVIKQADERAAESIADVILRRA